MSRSSCRSSWFGGGDGVSMTHPSSARRREERKLRDDEDDARRGSAKRNHIAAK